MPAGAPGQLETEIQDNGWLHCDADPDLVFGRDVEEKYLRALRKIGIDPGMLSERGRARIGEVTHSRSKPFRTSSLRKQGPIRRGLSVQVRYDKCGMRRLP